jgi:hypothetical protein
MIQANRFAILGTALLSIGVPILVIPFAAYSHDPDAWRYTSAVNHDASNLVGLRLDLSSLPGSAEEYRIIYLLPPCGSCSELTVSLEALVKAFQNRLIVASTDEMASVEKYQPEAMKAATLVTLARERLKLPATASGPALLWADKDGLITRQILGARPILSHLGATP